MALEGFTILYQEIEFYKDQSGNKIILGKDEGAFGKIFKAKLRGRDVAVKELKLINIGNQDYVEQLFSDETQTHSLMDHENIVKLYHICFDPLCMIMELATEGSLFKRLERKDLSFATRLLLALDIALGIEYLHGYGHQHGIVHRDLKSLNIVLTKKFDRVVAKIVDFGFSTIRLAATGIESSNIYGALHWKAPELLAGDGQTNSYESDVYAFGVVLWELLSQKRPFENVPPANVGDLVVRGRPGEIEKLANDIPNGLKNSLRQLIQNCWHPTPHERPTASQIVNALKDCIQAPNLDIMRKVIRDIKNTQSNSLDFSALTPKILEFSDEDQNPICNALKSNKIITQIIWPGRAQYHLINLTLKENFYQQTVEEIINKIGGIKKIIDLQDPLDLSELSINIDILSEYDKDRIKIALSGNPLITAITWHQRDQNSDEFEEICFQNQCKQDQLLVDNLVIAIESSHANLLVLDGGFHNFVNIDRISEENKQRICNSLRNNRLLTQIWPPENRRSPQWISDILIQNQQYQNMLNDVINLIRNSKKIMVDLSHYRILREVGFDHTSISRICEELEKNIFITEIKFPQGYVTPQKILGILTEHKILKDLIEGIRNANRPYSSVNLSTYNEININNVFYINMEEICEALKDNKFVTEIKLPQSKSCPGHIKYTLDENLKKCQRTGCCSKIGIFSVVVASAAVLGTVISCTIS